MRKLSRESFPHMINSIARMSNSIWHTCCARLAASWWKVELGDHCTFSGRPRFRRHPGSRIAIGINCKFNSSPASNLIGVNRPCILSTLKPDAEIRIGTGCGFSGTVIGCAKKIIIGDNVRCGANTLITDTDWHSNDPRTGPDAPVIIENNVWLGVNVTVLKGVTIGEGTIVGAGSLVTRSLPPGVSAAGIPAKVLKRIACS
ncbi:acyltransferase [bacterium]|nr:acyltransferase [bacterium]